MNKNKQFEEIRFYAVLFISTVTCLFAALAYYFSDIPFMPRRSIIPTVIFFMVCNIYTISRYYFFNTSRYNKDWLFLLLGFIDIAAGTYRGDIRTISVGATVYIIFILIMVGIFKGRKMAMILTAFWLPASLLTATINHHFNHDNMFELHRPPALEPLLDSILFQIMLFIIVFTTGTLYRDISRKEADNRNLLEELEQHYEELAAANEEIEVQNAKLVLVNSDLEETNASLIHANKKLAESAAEFFTLQQISQAIGSILDISELLQHVNDIILGVLGAKNSTIILYHKDSNQLKVHTTNIVEPAMLDRLNETVNCQLLFQVIESGKPIFDNQVSSERCSFTAKRDVKSLICVPIVAKSGFLGLILIEQSFENAFDHQKVHLLEVIGLQVGMAMETASLYKEMHDLAIKDSLTGIYNRKYFNEKMEEELLKAKTTNQELSLIILDIDHFKKYNDRYGHLFGDKILKSTAVLIHNLMVDSEVFARFGGEEFVILLPGIGLDAAIQRAEDIRQKIAATVISEGDITASVTASFGVSNYPAVAANEIDLVHSADEALYEAKESGRNCVKAAACLFHPET